jgi:uncharacterized membrane protein (DUF4010 family)
MVSLDEVLPLAGSLGIGLLIGTERGWQQRGKRPGTRMAGVRTFALIGLLGGVAARISRDLGPALFVTAFAALAGLVLIAYARQARGRGTGATTEVAALVTFLLGAGPPFGYGAAAGAAAVVMTMLLGWKRPIHRTVHALEEAELHAALKLLALAFVLMPMLPEKPVGPWGVWDLREILWMVLLMAGLSFVGYVAVRRAGARVGFGVTALLGGLVSSTAVTLEFARRARDHRPLVPLLAAGTVAAGGTMFARVFVVVAVVQPSLLARVGAPLGAAALLCWGLGLWGWRRAPSEATSKGATLRSPLALGVALKFAALLAVVALLAAALRAWLGDRGVYVLAPIAGLSDVDAITLTLARQSGEGLDAAIASHGIFIAAAANTLVKAGLAWGIGGAAHGRAVALPTLFALAAGAALLFVLPT